MLLGLADALSAIYPVTMFSFSFCIKELNGTWTWSGQ